MSELSCTGRRGPAVIGADFDDAVAGEVANNQGAHDKMSDYFFTNASGGPYRPVLPADTSAWPPLSSV